MACCGRDAAANVYVPEQASSTDHDVQHWDTSSSGIVDVGVDSGAQRFEDKNRRYSWDLVIVMPYEKKSSARGSRDALDEAGPNASLLDGLESTVCCDNPERTKHEFRWRDMISVLAGAGLETYAFLSVQGDEVYIKVRAPLDVLKEQAKMVSYPMKLDKVELEKKLVEKKVPECMIDKDNEQQCAYTPCEHIYIEYDSKHEALFEDGAAAAPSDVADGKLGHAFGSVVRLKLTDMIISRALHEEAERERERKQTHSEKYGVRDVSTIQHLKKHEALEEGAVKERGYFPLHEQKKYRDLLKKEWDTPWQPSNKPFLLFRQYFGAKVGLFYVYLCHHTTWTAPLALVGLAISVQVLVDGRLSTLANELFALAVPAWAICLNEFWKRAERHKAAEWGMTQFEDEEVDRPGFEPSPTMKYFAFSYKVKGKRMVYYPRDSNRLTKQMGSYFVSLCMVLLVFAFIGGVFYGKVTLPGAWPDVLSAVNVVGIQLLNAAWNLIAKWLADRENYRTETEYEDALIVYLFGFQFVNSFGSLYYIAFIQLFVFHVPCSDGSCLTDLSVDLIYVFVGNIAFQLAYAYLYPKFFITYNRIEESKKGKEFSQPESEYNMVPFDPCMDTIDKYMDLARSFGYMVLFVVAFPAAPAFVCLSNYAQIHMDANNLLFTYQRVLPAGCQDIGTWQSIFTMLCVAAVVTNTAMIVFVMDTFDGLSMHNLPYFKAWMFIVCQYVLFHVMAVFVFLIPDTPDDVRTQQQRTEFIQAELDGEADDADGSKKSRHGKTDPELGEDPHEKDSTESGPSSASSYGSDGSTPPAAGAALPSVLQPPN